MKVLAEDEYDAIAKADEIAKHDLNLGKFVSRAFTCDWDDDDDEDADEHDEDGNEDAALRRILLQNWEEDAVIGSRVGVEVCSARPI